MSATLVTVDVVEEIAGPGVAKSIRAQLTGQGDACPKCGRPLLSRAQLAARLILAATRRSAPIERVTLEEIEAGATGIEGVPWDEAVALARRALCFCEESEALNEAAP